MRPILAITACLSALCLWQSAVLAADSASSDLDNFGKSLREKINTRVNKKLVPGNYYMTLYGSEDQGNHADASRTWAEFTSVDSKGKVTKSSISWLPADFGETRHFCVFKGAFSMILPYANKCRPVSGHNYSGDQTIEFAADAHRNVSGMGPYRIDKTLYDRAQSQIKTLNSDKIKYKADSRTTRKSDEPAINCMDAVASISGDFPRLGGVANTGLNNWGKTGTQSVLAHLRKVYRNQIGDPVDPEHETFDYVYTPKDAACDGKPKSFTRGVARAWKNLLEVTGIKTGRDGGNQRSPAAK